MKIRFERNAWLVGDTLVELTNLQMEYMKILTSGKLAVYLYEDFAGVHGQDYESLGGEDLKAYHRAVAANIRRINERIREQVPRVRSDVIVPYGRDYGYRIEDKFLVKKESQENRDVVLAA